MLKTISEKSRQAIEWFRTTARSINNQRDSYYYAIAGSMSSRAVINGEIGQSLKILALAIGAREIGRGISWMYADNAYIPIGPSGRERDHKSLALNAQGLSLLQMEAFSLGFQAISGHPLPNAASASCWDAGLVALSAFEFYAAALGPTGTGFGDLVGSYREVMWNYPGKLPERPVEKQELSQAITSEP